ncbi:hypothetical protein J6590_049861 [Homalodisca vitripennis]|nr:hypothetical protein J6590_049861 [Homalodisca vitripennis]
MSWGDVAKTVEQHVYTCDLRTTTNGRAGGLLASKDMIAQRSPIQAAATLDVA